jgi:hypothetical protein
VFNWCRNQEQQNYDALRVIWPELHDLKWRDQCVSLNRQFTLYMTLYQCEIEVLGNQQQQDEMNSSQPFHY